MIAITYDKETNFVFQHFWRTEYFCLFNKETDEEKIIDNGGYSHDSSHNATYVGFTGTPIDATLEVFGKVVDAYTMSKSVRDGITVNIVYEGRSAKVSLDQDKVKLIEKYYEQCAEEGSTEYQIEESQKAASSLEVIIGDYKSKYTDWSKKEDIKAELKVDIILKFADYKYPPVTQDDVYKEIFEQAQNFKKYRK